MESLQLSWKLGRKVWKVSRILGKSFLGLRWILQDMPKVSKMSLRFLTSHPQHQTKLQLGLPIHCWTKSRLQNKHLVDRECSSLQELFSTCNRLVKFLLWQAIIHVLCYVFKNCYSSGIKDLIFRILRLTIVLNQIKNVNKYVCL